MTLTDKEVKLIEYLRQTKVPFGEIVIRFIFQDGVIVRMELVTQIQSLKL